MNYSGVSLADMQRVFPGFGNAFLPSLVVAVTQLTRDVEGLNRTSNQAGNQNVKGKRQNRKRASPNSSIMLGRNDGTEEHDGDGVALGEKLYRECVRKLLWVATPEAMCRLARRRRGTGGRITTGHSSPSAPGDKLNYAEGEGKRESWPETRRAHTMEIASWF